MQLPSIFTKSNFVRNVMWYAHLKAFSFMEALFILLISGIFLGTFLPLYANTLKLKSDFRIRSFVSSENFSTLSNIQDSNIIELQTSTTDIDNLLEQGVLLTYDSSNNLISSSKTDYISKTECETLNTKEKITEDFEFRNCRQIYLKKIKTATNLYCFNVYSISQFSDGNWNITKDSGIFGKNIVQKNGSSQLVVANIDTNDSCAKY